MEICETPLLPIEKKTTSPPPLGSASVVPEAASGPFLVRGARLVQALRELCFVQFGQAC